MPRASLPRWARNVLIGAVIGFSLAVLAGSGLVAMAVYVAATEERFTGDECSCEACN